MVAAEVKALAEQSKQATAQVRQILGEIQKATQAAVLATEQGVKAVGGGGGSWPDARAKSIRVLAESLADVRAGGASRSWPPAQQQSAGVDQVALAMDNIRQVAGAEPGRDAPVRARGPRPQRALPAARDGHGVRNGGRPAACAAEGA